MTFLIMILYILTAICILSILLILVGSTSKDVIDKSLTVYILIFAISLFWLPVLFIILGFIIHKKIKNIFQNEK
jgi:hypothetical protein